MRTWTLAFAGLLLAGLFLLTAAKASGDDLHLQSTSSTPAMTPSGNADCKADLALGTQGAVFMQTGNNCGSCSDRFCQGSAIGNACAGGLYYTCQAAYGNNCTDQPTLWQCICWPPGTPFP